MTHEPITLPILLKNLLYIPAIFIGISITDFWILGVFLIIDVLTGIWRSGVNDGGKAITSSRGISGLMSKFLFMLIPLIVATMGRGFGLDLSVLAQSALGILILFTGYSIIGNIYSIRTGENIKEYDAVRVILLSIEGIIRKFLPPEDHKDN